MVLLSPRSYASLGSDPLVKDSPVMNPLITRMVEAFMSRGLASTGSDGRPWSRHHPAAEFARVAAEVAADSYQPSDQEVEQACEEFYDGTGVDDWRFMILLDAPACERARERMRRTLIKAQQSRVRRP